MSNPVVSPPPPPPFPRAPGPDPFLGQVPTDDPQAALRFCRSLAAFLATQPAATPTLPARTGLLTPRPTWSEGAPDLSIVVPAYNEEENLPELYRRLRTVLDATGLRYELIFVNDGSHDGSVALIHQFAAADPQVKLVDLARNFGHQVAVSAGLDHSRGQGVIVMDADLQDPPEVLPQFIAKWQEGYDVVYAVRTQRKEGWFHRTAYSLFYRLLQRVARVEIPLDAGDFCIMNRSVVDLLARMPERNRFVRGLRSWVGLNQVGLVYERHARNAGRPKYTFARLVQLALDGLVSFSYFPLRMISTLGLLVSLVSIILAVVYTLMRLFGELEPPGFATLVVATFFLAGVQLLTIGVIGEYVGRVFDEVKRRPLYILNQKTERPR